jgi:hypothetical protein
MVAAVLAVTSGVTTAWDVALLAPVVVLVAADAVAAPNRASDAAATVTTADLILKPDMLISHLCGTPVPAVRAGRFPPVPMTDSTSADESACPAPVPRRYPLGTCRVPAPL